MSETDGTKEYKKPVSRKVVSVRFPVRGHIILLGVVASEACPVSNLSQQLPTTCNKMQEGMEMDARCCELLANSDASSCTGPHNQVLVRFVFG